MYFVASEICITVSSKMILESVVFANLTLSGYNYTVNNYHVTTVVLEKVSLKTGTDPVRETWCAMVQYIR